MRCWENSFQNGWESKTRRRVWSSVFFLGELLSTGIYSNDVDGEDAALSKARYWGRSRHLRHVHVRRKGRSIVETVLKADENHRKLQIHKSPAERNLESRRTDNDGVFWRFRRAEEFPSCSNTTLLHPHYQLAPLLLFPTPSGCHSGRCCNRYALV